MLPYLRDSRYLKHQGRKVIIIYRPQDLPDSAAWLAAWRAEAQALGLGELHLVCALTNGNRSYRKYGFDAGVEFPPHGIGREISTHAPDLGFLVKFRGILPDYKDLATTYLTYDRSEEPQIHRTVFPSWDNTARRKDHALVTLNGTPENYEYWLDQAIRATRAETGGRGGLVFINAWNEWAEGCHLEPDQKFGDAFLQATLRAKHGSALTGWTHVGVPDEANAEAQTRHVQMLSALQTIRLKNKNTPLRRVVIAIRDILRVLRGKKVN